VAFSFPDSPHTTGVTKKTASALDFVGNSQLREQHLRETICECIPAPGDRNYDAESASSDHFPDFASAAPRRTVVRGGTDAAIDLTSLVTGELV
jgi:hypothetical protein